MQSIYFVTFNQDQSFSINSLRPYLPDFEFTVIFCCTVGYCLVMSSSMLTIIGGADAAAIVQMQFIVPDGMKLLDT